MWIWRAESLRKAGEVDVSADQNYPDLIHGSGNRLHPQRLGQYCIPGFRRRPHDLLFVPGWISNLDVFWEEPTIVRIIEDLASIIDLDADDHVPFGDSMAQIVDEIQRFVTGRSAPFSDDRIVSTIAFTG